MSRLTDETLISAYNSQLKNGHLKAIRAVADAAVAAYVADHLEDKLEMVEPFGYFRAEPFGWTECAPDDEGAVALYERPHQSEDKLEMVLPEGYVLVPVRPTQNMVDAAKSIDGRLSVWKHVEVYASEVYAAMISAAPMPNKEPTP